ncbi:MAG: hypothetical protein KAT38_07345 [Bacteroidales bacterium]|jgi:hypothetical protein|nr:hypothetical protein [Bacteroidales bacterium]
MKSFTKILIITTIVLLNGLSCQKIESLPEIPSISFKSFILKDTTDALGNEGKIGELTFDFEDGDGDIGLTQPDSLSADSTNFNLFFTMFDKIDGEFIEVPENDLEAPLNYRIPYIEKEGQNKALKGEIQVDFIYLLFEYDTFKYTFFIVDRALHKSNVETTPEIALFQ